jgi:hypothetical protein
MKTYKFKLNFTGTATGGVDAENIEQAKKLIAEQMWECIFFNEYIFSENPVEVEEVVVERQLPTTLKGSGL